MGEVDRIERLKYLQIGVLDTLGVNDATDEEIVEVCKNILREKNG